MLVTRAAVVVMFFASWSQAAEPTCTSAGRRTLTVNGSGVVRLPPDRVAFTVGVETQDADVGKAFRGTDAKVKALVASLKANGVASKDIRTYNLDIGSRDHGGQKLDGFRVSNLVTVTGHDPAKAGELIQAAVAAGANQADHLVFFVADPSKVRNRGLELAFQDARSKAETLAGLSHSELGPVVCIVEAYAWGNAGAMNNTAAVGNTPMGTEAGTTDVSFSLSVVFELK